MCRHLAYAGPSVRIGQILLDPPHGLVRQSWAPRLQQHGIVNADGFGVGWYVDGEPEPARHRGAGPVWADETFADLARVIRTRCLLAAVRSATPGMPPGAAAAAPLRRRGRLFSHNGRLDGWPAAAKALAARLTGEQLLGVDTLSDSGLLWALVDDLLERGRTPAAALAEVVATVREVTTGRFNLLLTDGATIAATAAGDTLFWRLLPGPQGDGVVVASEPYDDAAGWERVPEGHLLDVEGKGVDIRPLRDML